MAVLDRVEHWSDAIAPTSRYTSIQLSTDVEVHTTGSTVYIDVRDAGAHWLGRIGGIVLAVIAAGATGILFADSSSALPSVAQYAAIWPILLVVTVLALAAAVAGVWE